VNAICQGENLTALPTSSLNGITGTWTPALNNQATTNYTFTPTAGQCATTSTLSITVNPTIVPNFDPVNAICQGGSLTTLSTSSLNGITGTWSPALNIQATTTYTFTPSAGQCATTATLSITVNPTIVPNFDPVNAICQGENLSALPTSSLNGINGTWSPALNNQATTTYTFTPSAAQCATISSLAITVNPLVTPTFAAVNAICQGENLNALPTLSLNGISGTWTPALNNQATTNYTFTPTAGQCATTATLSITVNPTIVPTFDPVNAICQGENLSALPTSSLNGITGTWSPALNNQVTTTYTFTPSTGQCATTSTLSITVNPTIVPNFDLVIPICQGENLSALPTSSLNGITGTWSPALNNQATTTYTFTPSAGQCATIASLTITVNPLITPTFAAVNAICQGENWSALPTSSLNGINGTWSPALNNQATATYTFTPSTGQCATTATLSITVNPTIVPNFDPVSPICQGENLTPLPTSSLNGISGIWTPALNNQATATYTFTPSAGQCATIETLNITVHDLPLAQFSVLPPDSIEIGATLYFQNNSLFANEYSWYINNQVFSNLSDPNFQTDNENELIFTLIALNEECSDTFELIVPIKESTYVFAANCFTPDADEYNPTWKPIISPDFDFTSYHLKVYNRWGEIVWESFDYSEAWDGIYGQLGLDVQDGIYNWALQIKKKQNDQNLLFQGSIIRMH
jgi:gliding motility-associated-like protein